MAFSSVSVVLVALFVSCAFSFVIPQDEPRLFLERSEAIAVADLWELVGDASPEHSIKMIIALKQRNLDQLDRVFWDVSNPRSENYGKYLSLEDLADLVGTAPEVIDSARAWLAQHGITEPHLVKTRDYLKFDITVAQAESLLNVKYSQYRHKSSSRLFVTSLGPYSAPQSIGAHINYITGVVGFPLENPFTLKTLDSTDYGYFAVTPDIIRQRYNITTLPSAASNNSQAVAEFQAQYYSPTDLKSFFKEFVSYSHVNTVAKVVGQNDASNPGVEASLDIQYIMAMGASTPTWFWSNPGMDFWSDITTWLTQLDDTDNAPWVHSISYGSQGNYPSDSYRQSVNTEFQKQGTRGLSIIFASGDSGTGCSLCLKFQPSFPAESPYVTSVGATQFPGNAVGPEVAVEPFHSGGGFSELFDQPSYQTSAVSSYFNSGVTLPESFYYNKGGRGIPDVAALGLGFQVYVGGAIESVAGTSCAAPTFAGIVTLLNDIRLNNNDPPLGFLNQWLYQIIETNPEAFYDVTSGDNHDSCCGFTGFKCAPGWDPVTGLGTPNFEVLQNLV